MTPYGDRDPFKHAEGTALDCIALVYGIKRDPGDDDIVFRDKIHEQLRMHSFVPTAASLHVVAKRAVRRSASVFITTGDGVVRFHLKHRWWDRWIFFWRPKADAAALANAVNPLKPVGDVRYIVERS